MPQALPPRGARAGAADHGLHVFDSRSEDREVYIDVPVPGRWRLVMWTDEEWQALSDADRPEFVVHAGKVWFWFEFKGDSAVV